MSEYLVLPLSVSPSRGKLSTNFKVYKALKFSIIKMVKSPTMKARIARNVYIFNNYSPKAK